MPNTNTVHNDKQAIMSTQYLSNTKLNQACVCKFKEEKTCEEYENMVKDKVSEAE